MIHVNKSPRSHSFPSVLEGFLPDSCPPRAPESDENSHLVSQFSSECAICGLTGWLMFVSDGGAGEDWRQADCFFCHRQQKVSSHYRFFEGNVVKSQGAETVWQSGSAWEDASCSDCGLLQVHARLLDLQAAAASRFYRRRKLRTRKLCSNRIFSVRVA